MFRSTKCGPESNILSCPANALSFGRLFLAAPGPATRGQTAAAPRNSRDPPPNPPALGAAPAPRLPSEARASTRRPVGRPARRWRRRSARATSARLVGWVDWVGWGAWDGWGWVELGGRGGNPKQDLGRGSFVGGCFFSFFLLGRWECDSDGDGLIRFRGSLVPRVLQGFPAHISHRHFPHLPHSFPPRWTAW